MGVTRLAEESERLARKLEAETDESKKAEIQEKIEQTNSKIKKAEDKTKELIKVHDENVSAEKLAGTVDEYLKRLEITKATPETMSPEDRAEMEESFAAKDEKFETDAEKAEARSQTIEKIRTIVTGKIEELYGAEIRLNAEGVEVGSRNPEKAELLSNEVKDYLDLVNQAIADGDIDSSITGADILALVQENVFNIALQDRKASESSLGDHGVRHIAHNIKRCEEIFKQLEGRDENGNPIRPIKAIDKLAAHQIMTMHDIGYAFDVDKGHNAMSAKVANEQLTDPKHPIGKVFKGKMVETIHSGVLNHDSSEVEFHPTDRTAEGARQDNIESAVHLADNLHAFETKLPEILYSIPATLETMILLKSAVETDASAEEIEQIKADLMGNIDAADGISPDDKKSLKLAAAELRGDNYRFIVGRLCGTNPEIKIDESGNVEIDVTESAIHQEVVQLFGVQEYGQLRKFMADLVGLDVELNATVIDDALEKGYITGADNKEHKIPVTIKTKRIYKINPNIGEDEQPNINLDAEVKQAPAESDYEKKIEQLIQDVSLAEFGKMDLGDSKLQVGLEKDLKTTTDPNIIAQIQVQIDELKTQRSQRRLQFLQKRNEVPNVV